tara:strand:- start:1144 stop:2250 length:1107 start_codon:yes stop_codon:yes gene_type:complete
MEKETSALEDLELIKKVSPTFWKDKRVFLTGHTGFKGSWCSLWLQEMDSIVKGYALKPKSNPNLFHHANVGEKMISEIGDIREFDKISKSIIEFEPNIIIHMAAQPLVRYSYKNPIETFETNVIGTVNVLEAARRCHKLEAIIIVTSDKCYENFETDYSYNENDKIGGHDPYSSSKGCAELVTSAYRKSFFSESNSPKVASVRAGNVIGGGDWSDDRLIPDILRAFENNKPVVIRNPLAVRPWQHVLEPISGYLVLAQRLSSKNGNHYADAWNFGPNQADCMSVKSVLELISVKWGNGANWTLDDNIQPHEANLLSLDCSKAINKLNWSPNWSLDYTLDLIVDWHKSYLNKEDLKKVCLEQIKLFTKN